MNTRSVASMTSVLISVLLIAVVFWLIGSASDNTRQSVAAGTTEPEATATRHAELEELSSMQTKVASLETQVARLIAATATPTATPTVTPTLVPPAAIHQSLPYRDDWTISISGVGEAGAIDGLNQSATAKGVFIIVHFVATNNSSGKQRLHIEDWILIDANNRVFEPNLRATLLVSDNLTMTFPPSSPTESAIAFDVATDIGDSFILESRQDPMFRVQLQVVQRG